MARQYVHLTTDVDLARQVGSRRGPPCLVRIDARKAHVNGVVFMPANEFFWLAHSVPATYLLEWPVLDRR